MTSVSRRQVLVMGGLVVGTAAAGGIAWGFSRQQPHAPVVVPSTGSIPEPPTIASVDGVLDLDLRVAPATVEIGGVAVGMLAYNGSVPGPTLRVRAGDRIRIGFSNGIDSPTNLHTHGLWVSPEGTGDNPIRMFEPGDGGDYEYTLPADQAPGVNWYHPHHHGLTAEQVFGGLYGAIIVEDPADAPVVDAVRERVLVISDVTFDSAGTRARASHAEMMMGREGEHVLVNGVLGGTLAAAPGERERWRLVNACSSRYLRLELTGQTLALLGMDGGRAARPAEVSELLLAPGNRADLLVTMAEGVSILRSLPYDRGGPGGMNAVPSSVETVELLTVEVSGPEAETPALPSFAMPRDLRDEVLDGERTFVLDMGTGMGMMGGNAFTIDGKQFDPARVDTMASAGDVEEWTLRNLSVMDHPFHVHAWPMQVLDIGGVAVDGPDWRDVVNVPARSSSTVRIAFDRVTGTTVYHCHILDHEDNGMMAIIHVE